MARLLRFSSGRFERRTDYFYPQSRAERPRAVQRDLPLSGHVDVGPPEAAEEARGRGDGNGTEP